MVKFEQIATPAVSADAVPFFHQPFLSDRGMPSPTRHVDRPPLRIMNQDPDE